MDNGEGSDVKAVIGAFVPDLMDRSKLPNGVKHLRLTAAPELSCFVTLLVDLDRTPLTELFKLSGFDPQKVVAFGSHVNTETLVAANELGCRKVMARSKFFGDVAAHL